MVTLLNAGGEVIAEFDFSDDLPWPNDADGAGYSLNHIDGEYQDALNWRPSIELGGSPGELEGIPLVGEPLADDDSNGVPNLVQHAMGITRQGNVSPNSEIIFESDDVDSGTLVFSFQKNLAADDVELRPEFSRNLTEWVGHEEVGEYHGMLHNEDGTATVTWQSTNSEFRYARIRARLK